MTPTGLKLWMVLHGLNFHRVSMRAGLAPSLLSNAKKRGTVQLSGRFIGRIAAAYGTTPEAMHSEVGELPRRLLPDNLEPLRDAFAGLENALAVARVAVDRVITLSGGPGAAAGGSVKGPFRRGGVFHPRPASSSGKPAGERKEPA